MALHLNVNVNNLNNTDIMLGMPNCEEELFVNDLLIAKQYFSLRRCRKRSLYLQFLGLRN